MIKITKELIKDGFKKICSFLLNPRLVICVIIAWMITNGWSYIAMGIGTYYKITWLMAVAGTYLSFLWFPFTPEKIITVIISIWLLKLLFPNDKRTLAVLKDLKKRVVEKEKKRREKKQVK